jgi:DNA-binding transcriptional LysR family regulator
MLSRVLLENGVSLDRLASFHEVAERGSISAAAKGSASRQSLISRQIGELEAALGVALLQRESRPHRLTKEGEDLARLCREFFSGMSECLDRWQDRESIVSLASGESLLQWIILPLVRTRTAFKKQNLRLALRNMRTQESIRAVIEGKVDLALVRRDAVPKGLDHDGEFVFEYRLIVPTELAGKVGSKPGIEMLGTLPLAVLEGDGQLTNALRGEAESAGVSLDIRMECSSYPQIAEAIAAMHWAGFLPQFAPAIKGTTRVGLPELKHLSRVLTLAWSPKRLKSRPAIGKVVRALL